MKNTNFIIGHYPPEVSFALQSCSSFSYCMFIGYKGLHLHNTGYPQSGIDYDISRNSHRFKVIGVDTI